MNAALQLTEAKGEYLVDSRLVADYLGHKHQNIFELIKDCRASNDTKDGYAKAALQPLESLTNKK